MAIILTNKPFSPVATEWYPSLPVTAQVYDPIFMLKISFPSNEIGETYLVSESTHQSILSDPN